MENLLANDARNVLAMRTGDCEHARVIADCAKRLLDARALDTTLGGNEHERVAEANLRAALKGWM
jgi:hypothetical protein